MHEFSLVKSLLAQSTHLLREHGGLAVESIRVELGPLSGVEPMLVQSAFDQLVNSSPCRGAALNIIEIPLICQCQACDHTFEMEDFRFVCPTCASRSVRIVSGDEFRIVDVTIRTCAAPDLVNP